MPIRAWKLRDARNGCTMSNRSACRSLRKSVWKQTGMSQSELCVRSPDEDGQTASKTFHLVFRRTGHLELSVDNGIIIKGDRLVIPQSMWEELLAILHTGHLGMEKTKLKARSSVYWPDINHNIYSLVQECKVCQEHQRNTTREPLLQHEIPPRPWHTLGSDMFKEYLTVIDYY